MAYERALYTEFLRKVYAQGGADETSRNLYLDGLASAAMAAIASGKMLIAASAGGSSHSYSTFSGWHPSEIIRLIAWARDYLSPLTIDEALLEVAPRIRQFKTSTYGERVYG